MVAHQCCGIMMPTCDSKPSHVSRLFSSINPKNMTEETVWMFSRMILTEFCRLRPPSRASHQQGSSRAEPYIAT